MKDKYAVSMFGQKQLSREGGIEIVVKELCTRMARDLFQEWFRFCYDLKIFKALLHTRQDDWIK